MISESLGDGLILGTVQWGLPYGVANRTGQPDSRVVGEMMAVAEAAGVRTLDTARAYGSSETVIGEHISDRVGWRVITKIQPDLDPEDPDRAAVQLNESLAASLGALGGAPDTVLLHRAAHRTAFGGRLWDQLLRAKDDGRTRRIGLSADTPEQALAALEDPTVDVIQAAASLLDPRLQRAGFFQRARDRGVEVHIRSVFLQGAACLAPENLPPHLRALGPVLSTLGEIGGAMGCPVPELCLRYARDALGAAVVVGSETVAQLRENLRVLATPRLPASTLAELRAAVPDLPVPVLTPSSWPT